MKMNNVDIRAQIEKKRLKYYEVAEVVGIDESTLSKWMRKELDGERRKRVLDAIRKLK